MNWLRDAIYGLYGAGRLALMDAGGMASFATDGAAALRSFQVLYLVMPAQLLMLLISEWDSLSGIQVPVLLVIEGLVFVITLLIYLLVVFHLLELFGATARFPAYVSALNWAYAVQTLVILPLVLVEGLGLVPLEITQPLRVALFLWSLVFSGFVARAALGLGIMGAVGLVALDFFITLLMDGIADRLVWSGMAG